MKKWGWILANTMNGPIHNGYALAQVSAVEAALTTDNRQVLGILIVVELKGVGTFFINRCS